MFSFKSIVIAVAIIVGGNCGEVAVPAQLAAVPAPLAVPAHVGYAHGVPQNIAPYASQISFVNRGFAAPLAAAPFAPVAPFTAPVAARVTAPFAPAPYFAGPAPVLSAAGPYSLPTTAFAPAAYSAPPVYATPDYAPASYAAPFPYGAPIPAPIAGPVLRAPFGVAPAFVR